MVSNAEQKITDRNVDDGIADRGDDAGLKTISLALARAVLAVTAKINLWLLSILLDRLADSQYHNSTGDNVRVTDAGNLRQGQA